MGTIFSAYDIRGRYDETLTVEYAWTVGKAFAEWLPSEGQVVVLETPTVNKAIVHGLTEGVLLQGRDVLAGEGGDAQSVTNSINEHRAAGGVLVSHDDVQNIEIITLFDASGVVVGADNGLNDIGQLVESGNFLPAPEKGKVLV